MIVGYILGKIPFPLEGGNEGYFIGVDTPQYEPHSGTYLGEVHSAGLPRSVWPFHHNMTETSEELGFSDKLEEFGFKAHFARFKGARRT